MVFTEESLKVNPLNRNKTNQPAQPNKNVPAKPVNKTYKPTILLEGEDRKNLFKQDK